MNQSNTEIEDPFILNVFLIEVRLYVHGKVRRLPRRIFSRLHFIVKLVN